MRTFEKDRMKNGHASREPSLPPREGRFSCPHCGYTDTAFHPVCPGCGRPFMRDYIDTQMHPRDPNPQGVYRGRTWARIFLALLALSVAFGLLGLVWVVCGESAG